MGNITTDISKIDIDTIKFSDFFKNKKSFSINYYETKN